MDKIVKLENCTKVYKLGNHLIFGINKISLAIEKGEITAIVGPSGSGKTTLLNLIGCLDKPTEGRIWIIDHEVSKMPGKKLSEFRLTHIGFAFQTFNLIPVLTSYENIELPLLLLKIPKSERERRVRLIASLLGIDEFLNHRPFELSGGQQQRVGIGRALVHNPTIVLADEPTANLDSKTAEEVIGLIKKINSILGTTFIIATHAERIMKFADRIVKLCDGKIID